MFQNSISFSKTLFNYFSSIFDCFITSDLQLIEFDSYKGPYLTNNEYSDIGKLNYSKAKIFSNDIDSDKLSDTSDTPLITEKKNNSVSYKIINYDHNKVYENELNENKEKLLKPVDEKTKIIDNWTNSLNELNDENIIDLNNSNLKNIKNLKKLSDENKDLDKSINKSIKSLSIEKSNKIKIKSQKIESSKSVNNKKEKIDVDVYTDKIINLIKKNNLIEAEKICLETLDIVFNDTTHKNIFKAIKILKLLNKVYLKMDRYLEFMEVNKLISNIVTNYYGLENNFTQKIIKNIFTDS